MRVTNWPKDGGAETSKKIQRVQVRNWPPGLLRASKMKEPQASRVQQIQAVRVTNWPKSMATGGGTGGKDGAGAMVGGGGKGSGLAGGAMKAGGIWVGAEILQSTFSAVPQSTVDNINNTAGFDATGLLGDTAEGAMYGAMFGSMVPVIGTAVGAGVGGLIGAINNLTGMIEQRVDDRKPVDVNLSIDSDFGITTSVAPGGHPRVDSGMMMDISP